MTTFRARIRKSLANENLQIALDNNTERRLKVRALAFESIPDWRERRQRAHAVRADVIEHLDEYLGQFITKAEQKGVIVHRAKDANDAIRIVLEIANHSPLRTPSTQSEEPLVPLSGLGGKEILIAKSKSMVSEEINLNHALEKENPSTSSGRRIRVVETDLGEYIVQLRHERPAHIITPAVHLRRGDVGQLFHEKLGIPYTEDIPTLTNTARKVLREVFLTADIGISGANFGVAETGGICLVTNEGNGRMVTTLPRTHIALIGMERLVPTLNDLSLMLSLLPRSATGQKLSVYTQLLHGPLDGQQRHFIILDNGRSRLRSSPLRESLYCIRCGACLNACPVFRELGGHAYGSVYPGPIGSVISAGLFGSEFVPLAQASSLCGACKDACPVDIDLPKMLTRVRAGLAPETQNAKRISPLSKFFMQMYSRLARNPRLFAVSQRLAALGTFLVSPFSRMFRIPAFTGWGYSKDFPRFAAKPFRARFMDSDSLLSESVVPRLRRDTAAPTSGDVGVRHTDFITELTAVGGILHKTDNPTRDIISFLQARGVVHIHLEPNTLDESLLRDCGITTISEPDPGIRVGVTKAICGLADTGSVLIVNGDGGPLQASLLPEVHIAVLKKSTILPSLENAMDFVRGKESAVFITGPSRTADIEMTLTIGVHGPGEIHVFLVDD
ncbi:MAG: LUD domain-containing protein [Chloroflexota bacterium]